MQLILIEKRDLLVLIRGHPPGRNIISRFSSLTQRIGGIVTDPHASVIRRIIADPTGTLRLTNTQGTDPTNHDQLG